MLDPSRLKDRDQSSVLPCLGKVMDSENRVEYTGVEENVPFGLPFEPGDFLTLSPLIAS